MSAAISGSGCPPHPHFATLMRATLAVAQPTGARDHVASKRSPDERSDIRGGFEAYLARTSLRSCGLRRRARLSEICSAVADVACPIVRRRWSGRTTMASIAKWLARRAARKAERSASMWSTRAVDRRSASVAVKNHVPPRTKLRRYRTIGDHPCHGNRHACYPTMSPDEPSDIRGQPVSLMHPRMSLRSCGLHWLLNPPDGEMLHELW